MTGKVLFLPVIVTACWATAGPCMGVPQSGLKTLYYGCAPGQQGPGVFLADPDFANPVRLTTPRLNEPMGEAYPFMKSGCDVCAASRDGRKVAVSRNGYLHVADLEALVASPGMPLEPVRDRSGAPIDGWAPAWSPDGTRIALHTDAKGLWDVRPDGTGYRLLVPSPEGAEEIREHEWSPDGKAIAFRMGPLEASHLYLLTGIGAPGKPKVRQLTANGRYMECRPHWSPDGKKLLFTRGLKGSRFGGATADIWTLDLATGRETRLTNTPDRQEMGVGWCPFDGMVYYHVQDPFEPGGPMKICRMRPDGDGVEQFPLEVAPAGGVCWVQLSP